ncbi:hypothetical protein KKH23_04790 [Patescibacteria group bacterium]|nr:hypothetical protein [Patescibacteria group bacterium]
MADFFEGYYNAVVAGHEWVRLGKNNTLALQVDVNVRNAQDITAAMTGYIWFSDKTMAPRKRKDGTMGSSMAEQQLRALKYAGDMAAVSDIGETVLLGGNATRVHLKNDTYNDEVRLKISSFVEPLKEGAIQSAKTASKADVKAFFGGHKAGATKAKAGQAKADEADDDSSIPF